MKKNNAKARALEMRKTDDAVKMRKVSHSTENCRHCGAKISASTRYESGHREYDHEREHKLSY